MYLRRAVAAPTSLPGQRLYVYNLISSIAIVSLQIELTLIILVPSQSWNNCIWSVKCWASRQSRKSPFLRAPE